MAMDRVTLGVFHVTEVVDRLADDVEHTPESSLANRHCYRAAGVDGLHASNHAVSRQHGDGANAPFAKVLLDLRYQIYGCGNVKTFRDNSQCLVDWRQLFFGKLDVNYRADNLHHTACCLTVGSRICAGRSHTSFCSSF